MTTTDDDLGSNTPALPEPAESPARLVGSSPLLETKLYAPRWRAGLVSRPRLLERLGSSPTRKLTLVSAPAGFGKTTLMAEWLAGSSADQHTLAWLSLDSADNHPPSFWTYLISAIQSVEPGLGAGTIALLQAAQPPPIRTLLPVLLNQLAAISRDFALVLDDYHLIDAASIHEDLAFVLDHLPPRMHLVITARADPPLPLARLRARGELAEVRAADLRFTPAEAAAFLNDAMGLQLSAPDVEVLEARTEGWIAGLQLAALSMQGRDDVSGFIAAFTGDDRYIVDYLVEEVLQHQPDAVRRFLLQTSVLDRLVGPLCNAVTQMADGKSMLESLERANLFVVPLDDKREWYRYHHLFADVLHTHLLDEQPDLVPILHGGASVWYEQNALPSDAIRHALAANDLARTAGLVELQAQTAVRQHQLRRLIEWVKPIPDDLVRSMPVLSTYYAMALQGTGQMEASAARLSDAEWWLAEQADVVKDSPAPSADMVVVDQNAFDSLPSRVALARGYLALASGDAAGTMEQASRGLDLLPADEHHWRGAGAALVAHAYWVDGDLDSAQAFHEQGLASLERAGDIVLALSSAAHDADLLKARGRLSEARRRYERALQLATEYREVALPGVALLHLGLSELYCELNDLAGAASHLDQAESLAGFAAQAMVPYRRCRARARLLQAHGDLDGAIEWLEQAERLFVRGAVPDVRPLSALKARTWLQQGRLAEALAWTMTQGLAADNELTYLREFHHLTLVRVLIAQFETTRDERPLQDAEHLLQRLLLAAEAGGRTGAVIEILLLQSIAQRAESNIAAALIPLDRALTLAEPEGYVRLFLDEGAAVLDLLHEAIAANIEASYARRLLSASEAQPVLESLPASPATHGLASPLTAREIEILRLIQAGLRNQQIADQLVISPSTVKRHIANTYGKLAATHRTDALRRAIELNLL